MRPSGRVFRLAAVGGHLPDGGSCQSCAGWPRQGSLQFQRSPKGLTPASGPVRGPDGNFYGTTRSGGTRNNGTIYRITPAGVLTTLYSFSGGLDGGGTLAGLILGKDGNFYGTTQYGGLYDDGAVFRVTPAGALTTIYSFTNSLDGANPAATLTLGDDGNLYGTASNGLYGYGLVFRVNPAGQLTPLYNFTGGEDGGIPDTTALVKSSDGSFYGATHSYDPSGFAPLPGTIYRITPAGVLTTLYVFTYTDGAPVGLTLGRDGNLYGTAGAGTSGSASEVFQCTPEGVLTVLYNFAGDVDGDHPAGVLVQGRNGKFYGTTQQGGTSGNGTVYSITADGTFNSIASFDGGAGGGFPYFAGLVLGNDGNFYGTTLAGGTNGWGTLFRVTRKGVLKSLYSFTDGVDGA